MGSENNSVIYFFDKCRLCLDNPGIKNIYEEHLQEDVLSCTGVKVTPTDELPQKLCEICHDIVVKAQWLRVLATKNNQFLKTLFDSDSEEESRLVIAKSEPNSDVETTGSSTVPGLRLRGDLFNTQNPEVPNQDPGLSEERQKALQIFLDNGSTDFECLTCNRRYPTYKKLYHHQRQHNKTLSCPMDGCSKTFASKADLKKHERTHTGEKPYNCNICDKTFAQKITLKQHKESIHNVLHS